MTSAVNDQPEISDQRYREAMASVRHTLERLRRLGDDEKQKLQHDLEQMQEMSAKLTSGRVEIVVFGEISTGKSALINALVGAAVAEVDVRGGWTREVWHVPWQGSGYVVPGLADSQVVLVDTPGLNEVGGAERGNMAGEAARRADLIVFVTDSDLNETEHSALLSLAAAHKPIIVVLNKIDLYSPEQRARLLEVLRDDRLKNLVPAGHVVTAAADPREVQYIIETADGRNRSEWRKPAPDVEQLKALILELLEQEGLALIALNAAMYAADKSDRIAAIRIKLRNTKAQQVVWGFAATKAVLVAINPLPVADVLGGTVVDVMMVVTLSHVYGLAMSWEHARRLVTTIVTAAGWVMLGELTTHVAAMLFKTLTVGYGTVLTAIPQGAAAGYGSYIVGQAAKFYFEHGNSWGGEAPKAVVRRILDQTDKQSVLANLREEIRRKLHLNPHAGDGKMRDEGWG
jgi:small GTP-binding protein